jgi:hypothetical protein
VFTNRPKARLLIVASCAFAALVAGIALLSVRTAPIRESVNTLLELMNAAERDELDRARSLCSRRFLEAEGLRRSPDGGMIGLPRSIRKNFRAWRSGGSVLVCPSGRTGVVYRFVREEGRWRFDGAAGLLGPGP